MRVTELLNFPNLSNEKKRGPGCGCLGLYRELILQKKSYAGIVS